MYGRPFCWRDQDTRLVGLRTEKGYGQTAWLPVSSWECCLCNVSPWTLHCWLSSWECCLCNVSHWMADRVIGCVRMTMTIRSANKGLKSHRCFAHFSCLHFASLSPGAEGGGDAHLGIMFWPTKQLKQNAHVQFYGIKPLTSPAPLCQSWLDVIFDVIFYFLCIYGCTS